MTNLEFLREEAAVANASLPSDTNIQIEKNDNHRFDVSINGELVAGRLTAKAAHACIMGIGGAFAFMAASECSM